MPTPTSNARTYFEYIKAQPDPFSFLSSIPDPAASHFPFFEEEWIDFKGNPRDDKDARKIWSKALSGYANITDGLIAWGIDARKMPPRDIDAASGLRLIPDPAAFESKLRDWIRDATNPPAMGLEFQSYAGSSGEGFVVCLIPESGHKPHRAEFADRHYYYRAGDDFLQAEPGLLRILFYPQYNPLFEVEMVLSFEIKTEPGSITVAVGTSVAWMKISYLLHNNGTATAKNAFVIINRNEGTTFAPQIGGNWRNVGSPKGDFAFECKSPIHPGSVSHMLDIRYETHVRPRVGPHGNEGLIPHFPAIEVAFDVFADNYSEGRIVTTIDCTELDHERPESSKRFTARVIAP